MGDSGNGIKDIGEAVGNVLLSPLESVCDGAQAIGRLPGQLIDGDHGAVGRGLLDIAGAASTIVTAGADPAALAKGAAAKGIVGQASESAGLKPGEIVLGQSCLGRVFDVNARGAPLTAMPWMEQGMDAANSPKAYSGEGMPELGSQLPPTTQVGQPRPVPGMSGTW